MNPEITIRPETPDDRIAISRVHDHAFFGTAESELVEALRRDGNLILSLVALTDVPVGHIAFSRVTLPEFPIRASALAPLGVVRWLQRQGIGSALVRESLRQLSDLGEDLVIVLGDPSYYGRFGFTAEEAVGIKSVYSGPYLQALALSEQGRRARGLVRYARAFEGLN